MRIINTTSDRAAAMLRASSNITNSPRKAARTNVTAAPIQTAGATSFNKKRPAPPAHQEVIAKCKC
jgi:hypothetical protein